MNEMENMEMAIEATEPEVVEDYSYDYEEGDYKEESHTARNIAIGALLAAGIYGAYRGVRYLWKKRKASAMENPPQIMDMDSPTLTIGENEPIDIEKRIALDLEESEEVK